MNWLKQLFEPAPTSSTDNTLDLHRAAAALLMEVAHTDGKLDPREEARLISAIERHWRLDHQEMLNIVDALHQRLASATDLFEFTRPLREHWDPEQRVTLIEEMWFIAAADGQVDAQEEYLIRRVSELLYVSHGDFIRAKLKAVK